MTEQPKFNESAKDMTQGANFIAMLFGKVVMGTDAPNEDYIVAGLHTAVMNAVAAVLKIEHDSCLPPDESTPTKVRALILELLDKHWDTFMQDGIGSAEETYKTFQEGIQ